MGNFIKILTMPDNIPIVGMLVLAIFFLWLSFKQAFSNDKLIDAGKKEEIIDKMEE